MLSLENIKKRFHNDVGSGDVGEVVFKMTVVITVSETQSTIDFNKSSQSVNIIFLICSLTSLARTKAAAVYLQIQD